MDLEAVNGKLSRLAPLRDASIGPAPPPSLETWSCLGWWEGWRPVSFDGLGCPSKAQVPMLEGVEMPPVFLGEGAALFLAGNHASDFPRLDTCPTLPPTRRRRKEPIPPCCLTLTLTPLSLAGLAQTERVPFAVPRQLPLARPRPPQIPPTRISPLQIETRPATTPSDLRDSPKTSFLASISTPPSPPPPTYPTFSSQAGTQTRPTDRLRGAGVNLILSTTFPRTRPYAGTRAAAPSSSVSRQ